MGIRQLQRLQEDATRPFFDIRSAEDHGTKVERLKTCTALAGTALKSAAWQLHFSYLPYAVQEIFAFDNIDKTLLGLEGDGTCFTCQNSASFDAKVHNHELQGALQISRRRSFVLREIDRVLKTYPELSHVPRDREHRPRLYYDETLMSPEQLSDYSDCLDRNDLHRLLDRTHFYNVAESYKLYAERFEQDSLALIEQDILMRSPQHIACQKGCGVHLMLLRGADPSARTVYGSLPLHYAAAMGSLVTCHLLLGYKDSFDIEEKDCKGKTARDYAEERGHLDIMLLIDSALESS